MSDAVTPFVLNIPQSQLDDLNHRLDLTRWPEKETVDDWSQGAPLSKVRALCDHWRHGYDWRRFEARLNALGQFRTEIDRRHGQIELRSFGAAGQHLRHLAEHVRRLMARRHFGDHLAVIGGGAEQLRVERDRH